MRRPQACTGMQNMNTCMPTQHTYKHMQKAPVGD